MITNQLKAYTKSLYDEDIQFKRVLKKSFQIISSI